MKHHRGRWHRPALALAALAAAALVTAGCGSSGSNSATASGSGGSSSASTKVMIGISVPLATMFPPYVAEEIGAFEKEGIEAEIKIVPSGQILAALASGTIQFAVTSAPQMEVGAQKAPIKVIAQWTPHLNAQFVGGPGISTPAELAGKRVTEGASGSASAVLATKVLNEAGVDPSAVQLVPLPSIAQVIPLFLKGQLDATVVGPPLTGVLLAEPGASVLADFKTLEFTGGLIAGNVGWMEDNHEATVATLRALNQGLEAWWDKPQLAEKVIEKDAQITEPKEVKGAYEATTEVFLKQLAPESVELAKTVLQTSMENGIPQADPANAAEVTDATYLEEALGGS